jgi:hypothetical protein
MGKAICKWILMVMVAFISISAQAWDDGGKKSTTKNPRVKGEYKKPTTASKKDQEDTLVYDKAKDDTLTFGDEKSIDDTLIFADDEMPMKGKSNNATNDFSIVGSQNSIALNPVIYPNPSFGKAHLEMGAAVNSTTEIIVTSHDGTIIKRDYTKDTSYELTNLAAGKYIVTIKNGNQTVQKRLFVK